MRTDDVVQIDLCWQQNTQELVFSAAASRPGPHGGSVLEKLVPCTGLSVAAK